MNTESLRAAFLNWWSESYATTPGVHAIMTHTAFAEHVLALMELCEEVEEPADG
jgi:hypothetical protein